MRQNIKTAVYNVSRHKKDGMYDRYFVYRKKSYADIGQNGILDVYRKLSYESIGLLYLKAVYGKMSYVIIG